MDSSRGPAPPRRLAVREPFAAEPLLRFLGDRAIPGVESADGRTFRRAVRTAGGRGVVLGLTLPTGDGVVGFDVSTDLGTELDGLVRAARRLLDLDADPSAIDGTLRADPVLRPLVRRTPGIRVPGAVDGFELAIRAVVGQQISVAGARTVLGRIAARWGTPLEHPVGPITTLFPTAEQLANAEANELWMPRARAVTLLRLAELVAGGLDLSPEADPGSTSRALLEIPGIGPWTASYISMRALKDPDAFPAADLGVRHGFEALGLPVGRSAILERAERWRPWRAYAVMLLWSR